MATKIKTCGIIEQKTDKDYFEKKKKYSNFYFFMNVYHSFAGHCIQVL